MNVGRILLRLTMGSIFIEHGTQKLFGWFDGGGPDGTGQFFESVGLDRVGGMRSWPERQKQAAAHCSLSVLRLQSPPLRSQA